MLGELIEDKSAFVGRGDLGQMIISSRLRAPSTELPSQSVAVCSPSALPRHQNPEISSGDDDSRTFQDKAAKRVQRRRELPNNEDPQRAGVKS